MIIRNDQLGLSSLNRNTQSRQSIAGNIEKLSSGYKINRSADNAAGLAILQKIYSQQTGLSTSSVNTQDATSFVQTADGALGSVSDMYSRLNELSLKASNSIYGTSERNAMQQEADAIMDEIARIGEQTNFNGIELFSGEDISFQVGDTASQSVQINLSEIPMPEIDLSSASSALASSESVRAASEALGEIRGEIGAMENSLEHTYNNINVTNENLIAAGSRIGDTDIAMEIMNFTRNNLLQNSAFAMMSQANQNANLMLNLLR